MLQDQFNEYHTLSHDLVDLAIFLTTDELLMLICKLNFDTDLVLGSFDEWYLMDDHHCGFDSIVGTIDGENEFIKANLSCRIKADVGEHSTYVRW